MSKYGYSRDARLDIAPEGWFSDEEAEDKHLTKKTKLSNRFTVATTKEVESYSDKKAPKNTTYSTTWALRNYEDWVKQRNLHFPEEAVPSELLTSGTSEELNKWLSFYVLETRKSKGERYPPKTIYQLLTGLLRHMRTVNPNAPNFLDKTNYNFRKLHNVIDNLFKELSKEGVAAQTKHAEIVTKEEENLLWSSGVIGIHTPKALLNAVFYCNGKNFCLRGGQEHRELRLSQFTREEGHYVYTENVSKNHQGGWSQMRLGKKCVPIYSQPDSNERCHVRILDLYISKLPDDVKCKDFFYARPLPIAPSDPSKPWFSSMPTGKNTLSSMFKNMCTEAGISGHKRNHSLPATGASELFEAGVPEKIIKERTGHRSLEALRLYERTTKGQHMAVSAVHTSSHKTTFQQALRQEQTLHSLTSTGQNIFQNCSVQVFQAPVASVQPPVYINKTFQDSCQETENLPQVTHKEMDESLKNF